MGNHPFIFSNELRYRLWRHAAFWASWWLAQSFLYSFVVGLPDGSYSMKLLISMINATGFMPPHMFLAYSLMYFVIPRYLLKEKYIVSAVLTLLMFLATGMISAVIGVFILPRVQLRIVGPAYLPYLHSLGANFGFSLLGGLRGAITSGGVAAAIKLMKYWYVKQMRNMELQKENIASQLQLLKAQVHPHFLFNTLNNVYAHAQVGSSSAPVLIAGLSDLLRYMLYECDRPLALLDKELKMVQDYVLLERVRYGNKLDVSVEISGDTKDVYIAPLLLLPFIENCFKHGTSQMLEQPWVSLRVVVEGDRMTMKLLNGKLPAPSSSAGGIGIVNVVRRLEYMYPEKHQLVIDNEEDVYIVNLKLQLERRASPETSVKKDTNSMIYELT